MASTATEEWDSLMSATTTTTVTATAPSIAPPKPKQRRKPATAAAAAVTSTPATATATAPQVAFAAAPTPAPPPAPPPAPTSEAVVEQPDAMVVMAPDAPPLPVHLITFGNLNHCHPPTSNATETRDENESPTRAATAFYNHIQPALGAYALARLYAGKVEHYSRDMIGFIRRYPLIPSAGNEAWRMVEVIVALCKVTHLPEAVIVCFEIPLDAWSAYSLVAGLEPGIITHVSVEQTNPAGRLQTEPLTEWLAKMEQNTIPSQMRAVG